MIERRQISYGRLFLRHHLWIPLIPLMIALGFAGVGGSLLVRERELARDGVDAVAVITHRSIRTSRDSDGNTRTHYRLHYIFNPTSDQHVEGVQDVRSRFYNAVRVGQEVPVRFLPRNPGVNAVEPTGVIFPAIFLLVGLSTGLVGLGIVGYMLRNKASILRAARKGEVREARVTGHEATNVQINGRTQYRFAWIDAAGAEGRSAMTDYRKLPQTGQVVTVYIDPRSGRGWWEGDF